MSMKIYNAFKIKDPSSVWKVLWEIEDRATQNVKQALSKHYVDLVIDMDPDTDEYKKAWQVAREPRDEAAFRLYRVRDLVHEKYRVNVTSSFRDKYSLDACVAVYPHEGALYLCTFCEPISVVGTAFDFVKEMPELEDFHYQNSTDKPDGVTELAWQERRDTWVAIGKHGGIGRHVGLTVVDYQGFFRVDPWLDLRRAQIETPMVLPMREVVWATKIRKHTQLTNVTASSGLITAQPGNIMIKKMDDCWVSSIAGVDAEHQTLNHAADHVMFEHLPERQKELVRGMIARHSKA